VCIEFCYNPATVREYILIPFFRKQYQFPVRIHTKWLKNGKLLRAILSAFYNIVQQNLGLLLILWRSFKLWWNFCLDLSRSKFCSLGNRSITLSLLWQTDLGRGANAIFFQGGVRTKDRFFSPGTDFAARANYILLRSYRINSNAIIFQFLLF
jgi:hypothetical protein